MQSIETRNCRDNNPATGNLHSITTWIIPEMQFDCKIWTGKTEK